MDQFTEIRTWAEISRSALRHNLNVAQELTGGTKIMCVIKGNAHVRRIPKRRERTRLLWPLWRKP